MPRRLAATLLVALALAGCAAPDAPAGGRPGAVVVDATRPETSFEDLALVGTAPDLAATLDAAPRLVPGEWWKYRFVSPTTGHEAEFYTVVAQASAEGYVLGMPHEGWAKEIVAYHLPCLGDVTLALGCSPHNVDFEAVRFPLADGATWTTQYRQPPDLTATVTVTGERTADIAFVDANGNSHLTATYDATLHAVSKLAHPTATFEVVDHGYDFQGWVTIPRAVTMVWEDGTGTSPASLPQSATYQPAPTVEVAGGFNRVTFFVGVGHAAPPGGMYRMTVTAPDGATFEATTEPNGSPFNVAVHEHNVVDGAWSFEHFGVGLGWTYTEAVAYHQYDIELPSGNVRTDHAHDVIR